MRIQNGPNHINHPLIYNATYVYVVNLQIY